MDVVKLQAEIKAAKEIALLEGIYVIGSANTIESITADPNLYFQKVELFPASAVGTTTSAGLLTANAQDIFLGLSGAAASVTLVSLIVKAGIATATRGIAHNFLPGQNVTISGATPGGLNGSVSIIEANTLTFKWRTDGTIADGPATGTITAARTGYTPDKRTPTDVGLTYTAPTGAKLRLNQVIIRSTNAGNGVFYRAYS